MQGLAVLIRGISAINWLIGQILSWLALACVLICFTVVVQLQSPSDSTRTPHQKAEGSLKKV